ncbi:class I SAM-dependent methyltransferase [bacterium]|nr:class I SAM-dependent methyltransferase [bacterium]
MSESKQGSFEFSLKWQSNSIKHLERKYFPVINCWRDFFPVSIGKKLDQLNPGESISETDEINSVIPAYNKNWRYKFIKRKINFEKAAEQGITFRKGRFYPRSILSIVGFLLTDNRPFRVLENEGDHLTIDINHPLHSIPVAFSAKLIKELPDREERGGNSRDIGSELTEGGPGLQLVLSELETEFFLDSPFARENENPDLEFYSTPRLVNHVDLKAMENISELYSRFVKPGMKVLDLMAGGNSHINEGIKDVKVTGLGMNTEELGKNNRLTENLIHDLNQNPSIPSADNEFDMVVCTVSVEYLTQPVAVFKEVGRVLKPGSPFVLSFSDRWFPEKVVRIWTELHPFERLGLVTTYFKQSGLFSDLHTETVRGYPRPVSDSQYMVRRESDPIFAIWGYKK